MLGPWGVDSVVSVTANERLLSQNIVTRRVLHTTTARETAFTITNAANKRSPR
jgi:hypothetical protein